MNTFDRWQAYHDTMHNHMDRIADETKTEIAEAFE